MADQAIVLCHQLNKKANTTGGRGDVEGSAGEVSEARSIAARGGDDGAEGTIGGGEHKLQAYARLVQAATQGDAVSKQTFLFLGKEKEWRNLNFLNSI